MFAFLDDMEFRRRHDWNVNPGDAVVIQRELRDRIVQTPFRGPVRTIAGADVSFNQNSNLVHAAFVVLDYETLAPVETSGAAVEVHFPYVPGLLSFREIPPLLEAWARLKTAPDVVVLDGQGLAHPRRLGIASHFGLWIERPTIGCAKSRLTGTFEEPLPAAGSWEPLMDRGERVGAVLRTKRRTNPVFVSPGHLMDLESSLRILMPTVHGYRIPEPTRQAHLLVNRLRREHDQRSQDGTRTATESAAPSSFP